MNIQDDLYEKALKLIRHCEQRWGYLFFIVKRFIG
jgi:hypothetical protein